MYVYIYIYIYIHTHICLSGKGFDFKKASFRYYGFSVAKNVIL